MPNKQDCISACAPRITELLVCLAMLPVYTSLHPSHGLCTCRTVSLHDRALTLLLPVSLSILSSICNTLQDVTPGKIAFTKPTVAPEEVKEQVVLFKPADLRESSLKLRPGDKVEFSIIQQDTVTEDLATDVTLVSRASAGGGADGKPLMGCVISVKEGFGFIRCVLYIPAGAELVAINA